MDKSDLDDLSDVGDWLQDLKTVAFRQPPDRMMTIRTSAMRILLNRLDAADAQVENYNAYRNAESERHEELIAEAALGRAESIRTKQFLDAAEETFDMALSDEKKLERLKALLILLCMNLEAAYQRHNERP